MQVSNRLGWGMVMTLLIGAFAWEQAQAQCVTAHRGASRDAPENTLAAFRLAWERGADAVEGDFYLTKDDRVVCIHDRTTKRTAKKDLVVRESTLDELRALDVGAWKGTQWVGEKIPTLEEVLATVPSPEKKVYIELKVGPEIALLMKRAIDGSGLGRDQIVVISFNAQTLREVRRLMPDVETAWLSGYKEQANGSFTPTVDKIVAAVKQSQADGFGSAATARVFDLDFVRALRKQSVKKLHVWTVNDPELALAFARLGVDGITTDRPGLIRRRLDEAKADLNRGTTKAGSAQAVGDKP